MHPFVLRKEIFLYWDSTNSANTKTYFDVTGIDDETQFGVTIYDSSNAALGTVTINRATPAEMWLTDGTYKFVETNIPDGYTAGYPDGFTYDTASGNSPDVTFPNVIDYDLYITKSAPAQKFTFGG